MVKTATENNPCASVASDICALFTALQNDNSKKAILTNLTKLFLLLYNERLKRKLLYGSREETRCSDDEEDNASLRRIFKNDLIILDTGKKDYTKYELWLNECYDKFLNMLFELLSHSDEVLVTKSLSLLFGSLQFESKIYNRITTEMGKGASQVGTNLHSKIPTHVRGTPRNETNIASHWGDGRPKFIKQNEMKSNLMKAFPIKLFRKIIFHLLKIDQISISTIKYICKIYLCFYYDLNYYFLSILKSFCILRKDLRDEKFYGDDVVAREDHLSAERGHNEGFTTKEQVGRGGKDILRDNPNTNLFIFSILINSIKPEKKTKDAHIRRKDYLKRGRIDELFFDLNDEELRGLAKRKKKKRRIFRRKEEKMPYDKVEMKKTFYNYDTDDSIVHSSGEESDGASSREGDSSTGVSDTGQGANFLRNANLMHGTSFSDEEFDPDKVEDYVISPKRKKKIQLKLKNRKNNLFISENVDKRIYARLYTSCWFYFITSFNHRHSMVLQLLHSIPLFVFPYTNNPFYLIDFFNYSFYSSQGLYTSLAALPGMFYILTDLNVGNLLQGGGGTGKSEEGSDRIDEEMNGGESEEEGEGKNEEPTEQRIAPKRNHPDEGENKLNDNMYTDYYKRLFELITPASFYYADTSFLKIIHASIKNQMIPLHYVISFLKKLLRVACLTSYNVSINILSVVYDSMNYFHSELKEAMSLSASVFMNLEIKEDLFCYQDLGKNFEKKKIVQMLCDGDEGDTDGNVDRNGDGNADENADGNVDRNGDGNADENADGNTDENADGNADGIAEGEFMTSLVHSEGEDECDHQVAAPNGVDNHLCAELRVTEKDITLLQATDATPELNSTKKLFSLQECLPDKYQINLNTLNRKELYMANHIFYEIILLNNHLCENLKQYSNVYHYSFGSDSFAKPQTFYTNPSKLNLQMESSLFGFLKNFLSFKKRKEADIVPCVERKGFSTVFL
ncbi:hypothetical protein C922_00556 [Plasmodium inui San Antonio 1]|uniref:CCAAT-binding factor domain-containing protein n=1 Tax=Plasmodium inui San Antonio 1 TaxID=1237626 RepID=W7AC19_9APIC|nr:hypothetical protein C922_00556 [Plasmodium inui San Antonio 1]EUD68868.1 hypothetical protein C922_00556 [Plasmodium inui San Antonio 1]